MRIDDAVRIGVGDNLATRGLHPDIARDAEALVGLANQAELREVHRDFRGRIARAVIDDDHLEVRVVELFQRLQARTHGALRVVSADDDRDHRHPRRLWRTGAVERHEGHQVRRAQHPHAEPVV